MLIIVNVAVILIIWFGRPGQQGADRISNNPESERTHLKEMLKNDLGFDESQIEQYLSLRAAHKIQVDSIQTEIRKVKKEMFDEVLNDNPQPFLSDSLLKISQNLQIKIEELTFNHFLDLKKLCRPDQYGKLKILIHELFRQQPGGKESEPSPPPKNESQNKNTQNGVQPQSDNMRPDKRPNPADGRRPPPPPPRRDQNQPPPPPRSGENQPPPPPIKK